MFKSLGLSAVVVLLTPDSFAAEPVFVNPTQYEGAVILFDAARHDNEFDVSLVLPAVSGRAAVVGN